MILKNISGLRIKEIRSNLSSICPVCKVLVIIMLVLAAFAVPVVAENNRSLFSDDASFKAYEAAKTKYETAEKKYQEAKDELGMGISLLEVSRDRLKNTDFLIADRKLKVKTLHSESLKAKVRAEIHVYNALEKKNMKLKTEAGIEARPPEIIKEYLAKLEKDGEKTRKVYQNCEKRFDEATEKTDLFITKLQTEMIHADITFNRTQAKYLARGINVLKKENQALKTILNPARRTDRPEYSDEELKELDMSSVEDDIMTATITLGLINDHKPDPVKKAFVENEIVEGKLLLARRKFLDKEEELFEILNKNNAFRSEKGKKPINFLKISNRIQKQASDTSIKKLEDEITEIRITLADNPIYGSDRATYLTKIAKMQTEIYKLRLKHIDTEYETLYDEYMSMYYDDLIPK